MMETRGFATVTLGLIRHQLEQVRPPRALWTPFQLGRPLGEPEDAAFQRRVMMAALGLLERTDGPVILEDFPDDAPGWVDTPGWRGPLVTAETLAAEPDAAAGQFTAELAALRPFWDAAQVRYGRTTVGLSRRPPEAWAGYLAGALAGRLEAWPLRYVSDDVKAVYYEAAQAIGPAPASRQIDAWFWRSTIAGQLLIRLRGMAVASEDEALKAVGGRFLVPAVWVPKG